MTNAASQLALREWRTHMQSPLTATALVSVTAILALVGPYGTILSLSLPERAAYWGLLVVLGHAVGFFASFAFLRTPVHGATRLARVALAGVLTGGVVSLILIGLNSVVFGFVPDLSELPAFLATVLVISIIVMAVIDLFSRHFQTAPKAGYAPSILSRLPIEKRGPLVALSDEDHYVRIRTIKGKDIQLMRLADAMREVGETPGAQVHRCTDHTGLH